MSRWLVGAALMLAACGSSALLDTALRGDLAALKSEIALQQKQGKLDRGAVEELAQAVARREVSSAQTLDDAARLRQLLPCVSPVADALHDRMQGEDPPAAEAALLLLESKRLSPEPLFTKHAQSTEDDWRAVAARAAIAPDQAEARRSFITRDPSGRVRREAIRAAADARDAGDLDVLLEAARLDPDPLNRSLAARSAGSLGGERAVQALWDRWARATEEQRISIVDAWSAPNAYAAGGQDKLMRVVESSVGLPRVAAAVALVRQRARNFGVAVGALATAISEGSDTERALALSEGPLDEASVVEAIQKASRSDQGHVRVLALSRLARANVDRDDSMASLRALAKGGGEPAQQARRALATLGDASVAEALAGELTDRSPRTRASAARALLELERYAQAATALGDDSPGVRVELACAVLARR